METDGWRQTGVWTWRQAWDRWTSGGTVVTMATTNEDPIKHINVRQMGRTDAEDDIQANISLPSPSHPMSNTSWSRRRWRNDGVRCFNISRRDSTGRVRGDVRCLTACLWWQKPESFHILVVYGRQQEAILSRNTTWCSPDGAQQRNIICLHLQHTQRRSRHRCWFWYWAYSVRCRVSGPNHFSAYGRGTPTFTK